MELMIVVTVVGIIAAFAIPNYSKAVNKALAKTMVNDLRVIGVAQEGYKAANGNSGDYFYQGVLGNSTQTQLNQSLGLSLISPKGVVYSCKISMVLPTSTGYCEADYPGQWTYRISTGIAINPPWSQITCQSGTCPTGVP